MGAFGPSPRSPSDTPRCTPACSGRAEGESRSGDRVPTPALPSAWCEPSGNTLASLKFFPVGTAGLRTVPWGGHGRGGGPGPGFPAVSCGRHVLTAEAVSGFVRLPGRGRGPCRLARGGSAMTRWSFCGALLPCGAQAKARCAKVVAGWRPSCVTPALARSRSRHPSGWAPPHSWSGLGGCLKGHVDSGSLGTTPPASPGLVPARSFRKQGSEWRPACCVQPREEAPPSVPGGRAFRPTGSGALI